MPSWMSLVAARVGIPGRHERWPGLTLYMHGGWDLPLTATPSTPHPKKGVRHALPGDLQRFQGFSYQDDLTR